MAASIPLFSIHDAIFRLGHRFPHAIFIAQCRGNMLYSFKLHTGTRGMSVEPPILSSVHSQALPG